MAITPDESYNLRLYWSNRAETPDQCATRFTRMLEGMREIDGAFRQWKRSVRTREEVENPPADFSPDIPSDAKGLQAMFQGSGQYYDFPPDKPWPELGYWLSMWNEMDDPFRMILTVNAGAYGARITRPNSVNLQLSRRRIDTGRAWHGGELRDLVSLFVEAWSADEASVNCFRYFPFLICTDNGKCLLPCGGWLTYLPPQRLARITPPKDVDVETLANGGAILTLCEEPFTIDNPRHLELAASLNEALRPIQALPEILS